MSSIRRTPCAVHIGIALLLGLPLDVAAAPADDARSALDAGQFDAAATILERTLAAPQTVDRHERAGLHELLAVCRFYQRDEGAADEELAAALLLDPETRLDPTLFPPARIRAFTELRRTLRKRLPNLPRAEELVEGGEFAEAVRLLRLFVALEPQPMRSELEKARTLLLASLVYLGAEQSIVTEMRRLARIAPKLELDAAVFPPAVVEQFETVRAEESSR